MDAPEPETTAFDAVSAQTNRVMRVCLAFPTTTLHPLYH
jgi:hypothetical protein